MSFGSLAIQMVTVSLPILLGYVVAKLGFTNERFESELSALILKVTLPCGILASIDGAEVPSLSTMLLIMAASLALYLIALAVGAVLARLMRAPADERGSYEFIITFGNASFIGFPVITAILGDEAMLYAVIGLIPANFVIFTVGVMMFSGTGGGARQTLGQLVSCLKSPLLISSVVVLVALLAGVTELGFVGDALSTVGQMTTPAALLLMGFIISHYDPAEMLINWRAYVACVGRLLVAPLLGMVALKLAGVEAFIVSVLVLQSAMPVATNGTLYAIQYGVDPKPLAQGTFISIIASIVTIPVVVMLCAL